MDINVDLVAEKVSYILKTNDEKANCSKNLVTELMNTAKEMDKYTDRQ